MRVPFLTIILIFFFTITTQAQYQKCASTEHTEKLMQNPAYEQDFRARLSAYTKKAAETGSTSRGVCGNTITLPVAIHFQNINTSDRACLESLVNQQIARLNADFQGINEDVSYWTNDAASYFPGVSNGEMCVEFCVATRNHPTGYGVADGQMAVTINRFNGDTNNDWSGYINIFVMDLGNNLLGYSPLGGRGYGDGVVIGKHAFGGSGACGDVSTASTLDRGRTLTHELGHYFFLYHVWGNVENCNFDDGVDDTPSCDGPNFFCQDLGKTSCGTTDMHMNFMDYSNDECMYMFSSQQVTRMENWVSANLSHVANNAATVCGAITSISCNDGIQNGDETGVDCGGSSCTACVTCNDGIQNGNETGTDCGGDCAPCVVTPTCTDGIQNGNETGVDCGGACAPCTVLPTGTDGIQNGNETGIDCGGSCAPCLGEPSCDDNIQNGNETGIDCGGSCAPCATCDDGVQNGNETGVDCGGACLPCVTPPTDCDQNAITVNITPDLYGSETTWEITDESGNRLAVGGPYQDNNQATISVDLCIPSDCYLFTIYDAFGDGMCCDWGDGQYTIVDAAGNILEQGGEYGFIETKTISVGGLECGTIVPPNFCAAPAASNVGYFTDFTRVQVLWDAVVDASRYTVQYRRAGDTNWRTTSTSRTRKTLRRLNTGTTYEYRLRSRCIEGWTDYSEIRTFTTLSGRVPAGVVLQEYEEITLNRLFPNPAADVLKVDYNLEIEGEVEVIVYDMLGRQVIYQKAYQEDGIQKTTLDVSSLQGGTHIIQIRTEEEMVVKKFIKK